MRDDLKILKLDATGKNWPTWKTKLENALGTKRLKKYLHGTALVPTNPADGRSPAWIPTTAEEQQEVDDYKKASEDWDEKDSAVKHYISSSIPDSLYIHLNLKSTVAEYFAALHELFENQSVAVSIEKQRQLSELKLKDGGDACMHIDKMMTLREELACMGEPVSNKDYFNMVFSSLPTSYNPILTSISMNMRLLNHQLMSHQLISQVLNEYNHLSIQRGSKSWSKDDDVAFSAEGKKGNRHIKQCTDTCGNCGWDGHKAENCWEEGGGKHGQAPKHWKL